MKLEYLNLSLISASISLKLLYQTLRPLKSLRVLFLPRSSSRNEDSQVEVFWPPKLRTLHLAGGKLPPVFFKDPYHTVVKSYLPWESDPLGEVPCPYEEAGCDMIL